MRWSHLLALSCTTAGAVHIDRQPGIADFGLPPTCGQIFNETGCGASGAIVLNVSDAAECCDRCGAYSCIAWTYTEAGASSRIDGWTGYPKHNW